MASDRAARLTYVLAPALVAGIVLAVGLGLIASPRNDRGGLIEREEIAPRAAKAELESSPALVPVVGFSAGERPGLDRPAPSSGPRPGLPARLFIPAAGVRATVSTVGATRRGIEIPAPGRTGWYRAGPRPGEPGRAVIVGHFDARQGPGVFVRLRRLKRGDDVEVRDSRGRVHRFGVVTKERVDKTRFPTRDVYGSTSRRVLVLVTCGGPVRRGGGYRDNVLVYARAR